jgi:hypothetical protein
MHIKTALALRVFAGAWRTGASKRSIPMLDVILVAAALGFFALSVGYTIACDRL